MWVSKDESRVDAGQCPLLQVLIEDACGGALACEDEQSGDIAVEAREALLPKAIPCSVILAMAAMLHAP